MFEVSIVSSIVKVLSKPPRLYSFFIQSGIGKPSGGIYETTSSSLFVFILIFNNSLLMNRHAVAFVFANDRCHYNDGHNNYNPVRNNSTLCRMRNAGLLS